MGTAEPADLSGYLIVRKEYENLPTAVIERVRMTEQDIETIKERLIPRVMKMVREWNIEPKNTYIEHK